MSLHSITFPRNFRVDWEVANLLLSLVSDTAARSPQQVRSKMATSRCSGIWETTRHNRHNGFLPAPACYGETGVMDFGLYTVHYRLP